MASKKLLTHKPEEMASKKLLLTLKNMARFTAATQNMLIVACTLFGSMSMTMSSPAPQTPLANDMASVQAAPLIHSK